MSKQKIKTKTKSIRQTKTNNRINNQPSVTIKLRQHKLTPAQQIPRQKRLTNVPARELNPQPLFMTNICPFLEKSTYIYLNLI